MPKANQKQKISKSDVSSETSQKSIKKPADLTEEVLNMGQAIALLKTTRPTFYRWLREGKLKGMKMGRQWRFYRSDVEAFRESPDVGFAVVGPLAFSIVVVEQHAERRAAAAPRVAQHREIAVRVTDGEHGKPSDVATNPDRCPFLVIYRFEQLRQACET